MGVPQRGVEAMRGVLLLLFGAASVEAGCPVTPDHGHVQIPSNMTAINASGFSYCYSLYTIDITSSVTSIGDYGFYKCTSLTTVTMADSVQHLGANAFLYCADLTSVTLSNSLTAIEGGVFSGTSLQSITVPNGVTSIGAGAFFECGQLRSVVLPSTVATIDHDAFAHCYSLSAMTLPSTFTAAAGAFTCTACIEEDYTAGRNFTECSTKCKPGSEMSVCDDQAHTLCVEDNSDLTHVGLPIIVSIVVAFAMWWRCKLQHALAESAPILLQVTLVTTDYVTDALWYTHRLNTDHFKEATPVDGIDPEWTLIACLASLVFGGTVAAVRLGRLCAGFGSQPKVAFSFATDAFLVEDLPMFVIQIIYLMFVGEDASALTTLTMLTTVGAVCTYLFMLFARCCCQGQTNYTWIPMLMLPSVAPSTGTGTVGSRSHLTTSSTRYELQPIAFGMPPGPTREQPVQQFSVKTEYDPF